MNSARIATAVALATTGGLLTAVAAPAASAATTCASPVYKRQIFANTALSGTAKQTGCDAAIAENWGTGSPASGVPSNNFSVRWTVTRDFGSGGPFAFSASAQDGLRVYVDGVRKVNLWKNVSTTLSRTVNLTVPAGRHTLRIDYANWTGKANVKFTYAPRTSASVDTVKPLAPTGFAVAYDKASGKARLTWAKNKEMDLAGYRVYRNNDLGGFTARSSTASTSYVDTPPTDGDTVVYEIRAYDKAGRESKGSALRFVTTVDRVAPAVPTGVLGTYHQQGAFIDWPHVVGAASYRVYRATEPNGVFTFVGPGYGSQYTDTTIAERAVFYYRVSAVDAAGNESKQSVAVKAWRGDSTPPPALTGLTATPTAYGFRLTWDRSTATDVKYYRVYQGELQGDGENRVCSSSYQGIAFVDDPDATSYAHVTVPDGGQTCLFVSAVDDYGNSVVTSTGKADFLRATELDMTPSVPTPEGSPLKLEAAWAPYGVVLLDWTGLDESAPEAAGGYRIYRWNPATSHYEKLADRASDDPWFDDVDAPRGTALHYWVTAVAADGSESLPAGGTTVTEP
ncbi:PA14 domain-containing protein [Streptomyces sp. NPDC000618]|uniref:fibronectin type III domain-containing protein n=1 Tax=Streptomyces sp. NPDC000618 TaxID=3154265 RepID=UPI0033181475